MGLGGGALCAGGGRYVCMYVCNLRWVRCERGGSRKVQGRVVMRFNAEGRDRGSRVCDGVVRRGEFEVSGWVCETRGGWWAEGRGSVEGGRWVEKGRRALNAWTRWIGIFLPMSFSVTGGCAVQYRGVGFFFFLPQLADLVSAGVAIRESRLRRMSAQGGEFATCPIASFGTTRGWCSVEGTFCKATSG